jgi:HD-GYP domain-containing protein (c-di-GMP phosphodiesterase class II)
MARNDSLTTLMGLAALINSSLDSAEIRKRAIEAATTLMDAEAGSLLLVDGERNELFFEVAVGDKGERLKEIRIRLDEGIAGWVARTGEATIVPDVRQDPRFFGGVDAQSRFVTTNLIAAPLKVKGRVLGVLEAMNKRSGQFSRDDLTLLVSLANLVASAVDNASLYQELKDTFHGTALALAEALEKRDAYTGGHTRRVRDYCLTIGNQLNLAREETDALLLSAILHDIGKIGVRDDILHKDAPLSRDETAVMGEHARIGADILRHVRSLRGVVPGVLSHHEKYDGSGYPDRLEREQIPIIARIIAVADTFDAMTTDRPYRKALSQEVALNELRRCSASQFDPTVVEAFVAGMTAARGEQG